MGDRLLALRKALGLTQTAFGEKLAIRYNTVGLMENGERTVTERTILQVCQVFGVNEVWLRTGAGNMFASSSADDDLKRLIDDHHLDGFARDLALAFIRLDAGQRDALLRYANKVAAEHKNAAPQDGDHGQTAYQKDQATAVELARAALGTANAQGEES